MDNSSFLVLFIAFCVMMGLIPFVLRRFRIPSVIALLITGMIIGPTGLNLIGRITPLISFISTHDAIETQSHFVTLIDSLGSLGLMFLMQLAGMEADFKLIKTARRPVILLSILTFLVPAVTGYLVYAYFRADDLPGKLLYASLFASHSVGIVFPVIRELKLAKTKYGASVLISTVITDISSIILLAVSVQLFRQKTGVSHSVVKGTLSIFDYIDSSIFGNTFTPVFLLIVLCYLQFSIFAVNWQGKFLMKQIHSSEDMMITMLLMVILITVLVGEILGINSVVGSFIAGLALSKLVQEKDMFLFKRFESIGYGFLIPFLFISIGMKTNLAAFGQPGNISIILFTVIGLIGSKMLSGFTAMKFSGFGVGESVAAGLMTVPQLSATLAAAAIGKDLGILDHQFFNSIIVLSIVTTLPVPSLVRFVIERSKLTSSTENDIYEEPIVVKEEDVL